MLAGAQLPFGELPTLAAALGEPSQAGSSASVWDWIHNNRTLIAEAYNPPFYPALDYDPEKAVRIAKDLNADSMRYPAASYYAYFPSKSGYPVHPELKGDPMRETLDRLRQAGLLTVAAGENVVRLLPPLIIEQSHVEEAVGIVESVAKAWKP